MTKQRGGYPNPFTGERWTIFRQGERQCDIKTHRCPWIANSVPPMTPDEALAAAEYVFANAQVVPRCGGDLVIDKSTGKPFAGPAFEDMRYSVWR